MPSRSAGMFYEGYLEGLEKGIRKGKRRIAWKAAKLLAIDGCPSMYFEKSKECCQQVIKTTDAKPQTGECISFPVAPESRETRCWFLHLMGVKNVTNVWKQSREV